jgi:hypothetical protein
MGKSNTKGRHIRKIGFIHIYAKDSYAKAEGGKKRKRIIKHPPVKSTELTIFNGKDKIEGGIKNIEDALTKAIEYMGDKYQLYSKKS